ncbi:GAF domain-containing sensor histidine kinase [Pseudalkalibacillus salsuginis]|uniref:GAF domain-containing sensor histidine kinase n=1 Tax=Pseudalkalibacillus salsuginis TaxID=2910972 RepID=UPI001F393152|nr:histidine kinase [Pseudalkalibacillus salsuginis]MCF6409902.1 histidine kinase [Pseudalkalibacillus salsuginis]
MVDNSQLQKKETLANLFLRSVSILGLITFGIAIYIAEVPDNLIVLLLFVLFLFITEFFPMAVWKGHSSLSFPLVFTLYLIYGLPIVVIVYGLIVLTVNIAQRRPLRILFFNPSQLVLSFIAAIQLSRFIHGIINPEELFLPVTMLSMLMITVFYFVINNIFVDLVLLIRPQVYPVRLWLKKFNSELISAFISISYIAIMLILGNQNRGVVDVYSYFFFFSPLVGLALLSSFIVRIQSERNRLNALFNISTELNRLLPSKDWVESIRSSLNEFVEADATVLWVKEDGQWKVRFQHGQVIKGKGECIKEVRHFEEVKDTLVFQDRKKDPGLTPTCFNKAMKAFVYAPIVLEGNSLGMLAVARTRSKSFRNEDVQSIATLANQLAVVIKTRMLIVEQEKRTLLEERNRIARDIHDGVAQSLAGAVMKLETAERKFYQKPPESHHLVKDSLAKLRLSLTEIRQSIYALRPYETERVGLKQAVLKRIDVIKQETGLDISYEERGNPIFLSTMVEKIMFDIFQESFQNIIKHAEASKVNVLLSYQKEHVLLKVTDNGIGFSLLDAMVKAKNDPHFGILSMNEQADKVGAVLQIDSKEGKGTEINLTIPKLGFEGGMEDDQRHARG